LAKCIALLISIVACKDVSDPESAVVTGVVQLQDSWGNVLSSHDGVSVILQESTRSSSTGTDGKWRVTGIPFGSVNVSYQKEGFGSYLFRDIPISEKQVKIIDTVFLAQRPANQLLIDGVRVTTEFGDSAFVVSGHFVTPPPANAKRTVALLFTGPSNDVSPDVTSHKVWHGSIGIGSQADVAFVFFVNGYRNYFTKGQTIYARAYAYTFACTCYDDPATGVRVFPNTGPPSNITTFEMR
jgi:hypothetical protein